MKNYTIMTTNMKNYITMAKNTINYGMSIVKDYKEVSLSNLFTNKI
jgi:hypothetical protein